MMTKDINIKTSIVQCFQTKKAEAEVETGHTRIIIKVDHLGTTTEIKAIEVELQTTGRIKLIIVRINIRSRMKRINTEEKIQ